MMTQKTLLFLGANMVQTPAIRLAKQLGHRVVTCDYLPGNPGHRYGDKYVNVSTVDREAVCKVAMAERIDGIVSFASDVSAPTAAYVAEKMGLPGHPLESVEILTHKDRFRAFLSENGFACPKSCGYAEIAKAVSDWKNYKGALVIKPVDSSGSKGVSLVKDMEELATAARSALHFSRSSRFLVETFVEMQGAQIIGDGFSVDGDYVFSLYGDHIFNQETGGRFAVQGGRFPLDCSQRGKDLKARVDAEVQRALRLLNMRSGAYNIEARLGRDGRIYLMEIGPRNGGNMIPELIRHATGMDLTRYTLEAALGSSCPGLYQAPCNGYWAYYVLHSGRAGRFRGIRVGEDFRQKHLAELMLQVQEGEEVERFANASAAIGVALCRFGSREEMEGIMREIDRHIAVEIECQEQK